MLGAAVLLLAGCRAGGGDGSAPGTQLPSPEYPIPSSAYPPGAGTTAPSPTEDVAPVVETRGP